MTIAAWILIGLVVIISILISIVFAKEKMVIGPIVTMVIALVIIGGIVFYSYGTASGRRALIDQKSDLNNGLERTINVYTANGDLIATYTGQIDIEDKDGGYIKFDFDGKRYMYYNCFVETIANIE